MMIFYRLQHRRTESRIFRDFETAEELAHSLRANMEALRGDFVYLAIEPDGTERQLTPEEDRVLVDNLYPDYPLIRR